MDSEARQYVNRVLQQLLSQGHSELLTRIFGSYVHVPPTLGQFLDDDYYLGKVTKGYLWPKLRGILEEIYSQTVWEVVLTGGIGWGKTTIADLIILFEMANLLCLRDPREYYGLMPGKPVVIGLFNLTQKLAREVNFLPLKNRMKLSKFFQQYLVTDVRAQGQVKIRDERVLVALGSDAIHALGQDTWAGAIDEANFKAPSKDVNEVAKTYINIARRVESRFMEAEGRVPGKLVLCSSKAFTTSFLEEHIAQKKGARGVYLADHPVYRVKPAEWRGKATYSGKTFRVLIGNKFIQSRILQDDEEVRVEGCRVEEVPIEHRQVFEEDVEGAIRDICGVRLRPHTPLLPRMDIIKSHIEKTDRLHPFGQDTIIVSLDNEEQIYEYLIPERLASLTPDRERWRPLYYPNAPRFVHLDLSKNQRATAICMGCEGALVEVKRMDPSTNVEEVELLPLIHIDFVVRLSAETGSEVDQSKVRALLFHLRDQLGFFIQQVTADQYQSLSILQDFRRAGMRVAQLSVDRDDEAYLILKTGLIEGRVDIYWYDPLMNEETGELGSLVHNQDKRKVVLESAEHSKDASDALAAVTASVMVPRLRAKRDRSYTQSTVAPGGLPPHLEGRVPVRDDENQSGVRVGDQDMPEWLLEDYQP